MRVGRGNILIPENKKDLVGVDPGSNNQEGGDQVKEEWEKVSLKVNTDRLFLFILPSCPKKK